MWFLIPSVNALRKFAIREKGDKLLDLSLRF